MILSIIAGLSLALMGSGAAQTQTSTLTGADLDDVKCFALYAVIAGDSGIGPETLERATAEQTAMLAAMTGGMLYHLGRLEGRDPDRNWMEQIVGYSRTVELAELQSDSGRCLQTLSDKGEALIQWGTPGQQP